MYSSKIYRSNVHFILFQDINAAHLEDLKKYIHPCERSSIEINERENVQEIFSDTLFFTRKKCRNKNKFLMEIFNVNVYIFSPFESHSEHLAQFVQRYHPGLRACKFPLDFTRFSRVLKSDKLTGAF